MTSHEWFNELKRLEQFNPMEFQCNSSILNASICQSFVNQKDWQGLRKFYLETLALVGDSSFVNEVIIKDSQSFEVELNISWNQVIERLNIENKIKSIYFEYLYDGADDGVGDFFLCNSFDQNNDDWASDFDSNDIIAGATISRFFDYDQDFTWSPFLRTVAEFYTNAELLSVFGGIIGNHANRLPVGFARHDHPLVRI